MFPRRGFRIGVVGVALLTDCSGHSDKADGSVAMRGPVDARSDGTAGAQVDAVMRCTSDNMCTPMGMLCDTGRGYCVDCVTSNDCAPAAYCSDGACLGDVCTQGASTCQSDTIVAHCKSDGSGFDTPVTCASGQVCAGTAGASSCQTLTCTPAVTYCDPQSDKILVCAADGLSSTTKSDCAASGQVCVAGACVAPVCPKGMRFCQGRDLRQCSATGNSSTLVQTCPSTQYCDAPSMMCKAVLCTPGQLGCNGNVVATCNADGSGFVAGGTACDPNLCSAAACITVFLNETFEDGSYARWALGPGNFTVSAAATPGANGTLHALTLTFNAVGSATTGLSYTFAAPVQPRTVSYWVKSASTGSGQAYTRFVNGTDVLFYSNFVSDRLYATYGTGGAFSAVTAAADTWYHVELRNIDWAARTFDFYVEGAAVATTRPFSGSSTSIGAIQLYNAAPETASYWDEIEVVP